MDFTQKYQNTIKKLLALNRALGEKTTAKLVGSLRDLRDMVENISQQPDIALRGGVYREMAKADVFTTKVDGCEFGYKIEDCGLHMRRKVFIQWPGYKLEEIPPEQQEPYMVAAFEVLLDRGQSMPEVDVINNGKCFLFTQDFMPLLLTRIEDVKPGMGIVSTN